MGGYNTTTEILSYGKHTLLIPRVHPRKEQLIRANRLAEAGYIDMLHPDDLSVDRLSAWLCKDSSAYTEPDRKVDFNGLHRLPEFIRRITHKNSARGTYRVA
jgi:predicted glycosyltransferase